MLTGEAPRQRGSCRQPLPTRLEGGHRAVPPVPACRGARDRRRRPSSGRTLAVVLDHRGHGAILHRQKDAHAAGACVLHDVRAPPGRAGRSSSRSRSARDPRRGSPRSRRGSASARGTSRRAARVPGRARSRRAPPAASSTASRRTFCSVETTSSRNDATANLLSSSTAERSIGFSEQDGGQAWPVSSCSSRASRLRSRLLRGHDPAHDVAADALREVDGSRGTGRERLDEAKVVVGEGGRSRLVVDDHDAYRPALCDQRDEEGRMD